MIFRLIVALGLGFTSPAWAGGLNTTLVAPAEESRNPVQVARAVDACNGAEVLEARFIEPGVLGVRCAEAATSARVQGGLGVGAGVGLAALTIVALAAAGGGGSSSSDTQ